MRMRHHVGTSGYSYKEWVGKFYPEDLKPPEMLAYYAGRLGAVEINNTFYRLPRREVLERWRAAVPDGFSFALKASRRITHLKRLKDAGEELAYLLDTAAVMGEQLGPVLFQLPPYLKLDLDRLESFLALLPAGRRAAFEFRHPSWYEEAVFAALDAHGAALVVADTGGETDAPRRATAGFGYLRLRREDYSETSLAEWGGWIDAQPWDDAWVFFKHEDEAAGPRMAQRFSERLAAG